MTLTAISDAVNDTANPWPDWYRWYNPITKRWWAARTSVPMDPRLDVMLISASSYGDLLTAAVHASPHLAKGVA
jgi:hypothetical protein